MYEAKGYSFVEYVKWSDTNYRSVVLAKDLSSNVKEVLKSFLIRAATREDTETIEDVYEPYLLQLGFIARTPRGRLAMPAAYIHLGLTPPNGGNGTGLWPTA